MRPSSPLQILKSLVSLFSIRGIGLLMSILLSVLLANRLGASSATDAFFLARRVVMGIVEALRQVITTVYIPPMLKAINNPEDSSFVAAWRHHVRRLLVLASLGGVGLALLSPMLVAGLAPGFDSENRALTTDLFRLLSIILPLALLTALLTSLMHATRRFALPELAAQLPRLFVILTLLLFIPPLGVVSLAAAMIIGTTVGLILLIGPTLSQLRQYRQKKSTQTSTNEFKVQRRILPMLLLQGQNQACAWIDVAFASLLGLGAISLLEYGQRLAELLPGLIGASVATVMYAEFSQRVVSGGNEALREQLIKAKRAGMFVLLPLAGFLWISAELIIDIVLQHGSLDEAAADTAAQVLRWYTPTSIFAFVTSMMMAALFADHNASHLRITLLVAIASIVLRLLCVALFSQLYGIAGIALAISVATGLLLILAYPFFWHHWGPLIRATDLLAVGKMLLATAVAAVTMVTVREWLLPETTLTQILSLAAVGLSGAATYLGASLLLQIRELDTLKELLLRKKQTD